MNNIRQTDSYSIPDTTEIVELSPFEQLLKDHYDKVKQRYEQKKAELKQAKKDLVDIKYMEKFNWLGKYMNSLEVFHINQLHRFITLMKDDLG